MVKKNEAKVVKKPVELGMFAAAIELAWLRCDIGECDAWRYLPAPVVDYFEDKLFACGYAHRALWAALWRLCNWERDAVEGRGMRGRRRTSEGGGRG
jgi:hypothetical protein